MAGLRPDLPTFCISYLRYLCVVPALAAPPTISSLSVSYELSAQIPLGAGQYGAPVLRGCRVPLHGIVSTETWNAWLVVWLLVWLVGVIFAFWGEENQTQKPNKLQQVLTQSQAGVGSLLSYFEKGSEINMKQAVLGHLFSPTPPHQQPWTFGLDGGKTPLRQQLSCQGAGKSRTVSLWLKK